MNSGPYVCARGCGACGNVGAETWLVGMRKCDAYCKQVYRSGLLMWVRAAVERAGRSYGKRKPWLPRNVPTGLLGCCEGCRAFQGGFNSNRRTFDQWPFLGGYVRIRCARSAFHIEKHMRIQRVASASGRCHTEVRKHTKPSAVTFVSSSFPLAHYAPC